jgi:hypothetical protein
MTWDGRVFNPSQDLLRWHRKAGESFAGPSSRLTGPGGAFAGFSKELADVFSGLAFCGGSFAGSGERLAGLFKGSAGSGESSAGPGEAFAGLSASIRCNPGRYGA